MTAIIKNFRFNKPEAFKIKDKIKELEELCAQDNLNVLEGANIVIAIPSLDESGNSIFSFDSDLYYAQKRDARTLASYIREKTTSNVVYIILDADKACETIEIMGWKQQIDYVIFLHEFMPSEKDYILGELSESCDGMPKAIELY